MGALLPVNARLVRADTQLGDEQNPQLSKVSLYYDVSAREDLDEESMVNHNPIFLPTS